MGHIMSICCQESRSDKLDQNPTTKASVNQRTNLQDQQLQMPTKQGSNKATCTANKLQNNHQNNLQSRRFSWDDFRFTHVLGSGSFGQVFLGELKSEADNGAAQKCVIKRIQISRVIQSSMFDQLQLERKILYQSNCKFITKLYYSVRDRHYFYIVMEWASGGDTFSLIRKKLPNEKTSNPRFNLYRQAGQQALRFILGCIILGMEYLHSKNIIYRDLKPENLLIFQDGYIKLADFGLAKQLKESERARTLVGTPVYYAPQVTLRRPYGREADLWALGVYCYEMSNYCLPFAPNEIIRKQKVQSIVRQAQNNRVWKNSNLSCELKDLIENLLRFDPKRRLGVNGWNEIKDHSFFTSGKFDWKSLEEGRMISPLKSIIDTHKLNFAQFEDRRPQNIQKANPNRVMEYESHE